MIRPGRSDTWTGPLVVIAVANLTAVVLCAWPVGHETLRKLVNFEISRPADDTSDTHGRVNAVDSATFLMASSRRGSEGSENLDKYSVRCGT